MVFTSPVFIFFFLPLVLIIYFSAKDKYKNFILLFFSLMFYAWGEVFYLLVMILSITINYFVGINIDKQTEGKRKKIYLTIGITLNLLLLIFYKYVNFISDNINIVLQELGFHTIDIVPIHLPLGISFFTFHAISYIVDVYKKKATALKNILHLGLYISLFPQLIAGPIIRYHNIARQIYTRLHTTKLFVSGIERFTLGLSKKMLIANPLGEVTDKIFALTNNDLTMPLAWIGIIAYSLQIYFDFSGYSDMAIGLGRMFGFRFLENFNYPYISKSLREFWRRWHISLSTWFRDYLYFPLGGSQSSTLVTYRNLLIVFLLTGFWHGASWNFIVWGLFHGFFLAIEHAGFSTILKKRNDITQHLYLLLIITISWVFFRAENLQASFTYLSTMINIQKFYIEPIYFQSLFSNEFLIISVIAIILSTPIYPILKKKILHISNKGNIIYYFSFNILKFSTLFLLLYLSLLKVSASTYNPFIYFRF